MMTVLDAVQAVLDSVGEPLHYRDIARLASERGLWQSDGATPEATVNSRLAVDIANRGRDSRFQRTGRGLFALRSWGLIEYEAGKESSEPEPLGGGETHQASGPVAGESMGGRTLPGIDTADVHRRAGSGGASVPVPGFQDFFRPMLEVLADGRVHTLADVREAIARLLSITEERRTELLPSGRQRRFDNRVAWTKVHLDKAGLIAATGRGQVTITDRGLDVLRRYPDRVDLAVLSQFEEYRQFRARTKPEEDSSGGGLEDAQSETPEEVIERGYHSLRAELASTLLERVRSSTPEFFEQLVVDLLLKMGYGGNRTEAGRAIGQSGDEGIDGIISEDRLGLDMIYIQAKRWQGTVGRPEIQKFVGALHGQRARKGVFLTTGTFSREAVEYVRTIDPRVVLIDGVQLAEYMIDYGLGVTTKSVFEIKRVDSDYFSEG